MKNKYIISSNLVSARIDKALTILEKDYSRAYFSLLIKENLVTVNGKNISPSYKVNEGDEIEVTFKEKENPDYIKPIKLELDIIYEDDDILIINKPQGLVVHPSVGHKDDTLVNALIGANKELSKVNGNYRVGIVHRIDKDTSGLLLVAKNDYAHNFIAEQLKDHTMHREYKALVCGNFTNDKGKIIAPIGRSKENRLKMAVDTVNGKEAITHFSVIQRYKNYTLVDLKLETGRTHQIRVHMEYINHPVVGDNLYGKNNCALYSKGQLLHAYRLTFIHPTTKKEVVFEAPLPKYFLDILETLH